MAQLHDKKQFILNHSTPEQAALIQQRLFRFVNEHFTTVEAAFALQTTNGQFCLEVEAWASPGIELDEFYDVVEMALRKITGQQ